MSIASPAIRVLGIIVDCTTCVGSY